MPEFNFHIDAPGPIGRAFLYCRAPVSWIRGPLGSAKTMTCAQRILLQMCEQEPNRQGIRPTRWLVVRNTYLDLTETTIKDFLTVFEGLGHMRYGGLEPPNFEARFRRPDGTIVHGEVIFLALDRPDSIRKLKGYQVTGEWWNEQSEILKAIVDMGDLRHGRYPSEASAGVRCTWHGMFGDTNSFNTSHWMHPLELNPPEGYEIFAQPGGVAWTGEVNEFGRKIWRTNPNAENLDNLPHDYYQRGMQGKEDDWIHVFLANEFGFTVSGKPVHPRFLQSRHVAKSPLEYIDRYPILFGMDFGRTPSTIFFQKLEHIGRYHVLKELPSNDLSAALYAPEAFRFLRSHWPKAEAHGWGDPAGDAAGQQVETSCIEICRAAGLPIQPAPSNRAALRRAAIDNPLMRTCMDQGPALLIDPSCTVFIEGLMGGYHYRQLQVSGTEPRYSDEPEKNWFSHTCEAGEYGLLGAGEIHEAIRPPGWQERMREHYENQEPYDGLNHSRSW